MEVNAAERVQILSSRLENNPQVIQLAGCFLFLETVYEPIGTSIHILFYHQGREVCVMKQSYITDSLEQHLFFARIMKEHAFFLKVGILPTNASLVREGERFLRQFEVQLARTIPMCHCVVRNRVLESGEVVTEFTDCAERQTHRLTGTFINLELTARTHQLEGRGCNDTLTVSPAMMRQVQQLNRDGLTLVEGIINYKERLLSGVGAGGLFIANYPLLIEHILREARLYRMHLMRLEGMEECSCQEVRDSELFWNRIMMEHAQFIRGLLDPCEEKLIDTADDYAAEYCRLLNAADAASDRTTCNEKDALTLTREFRDFKHAGTEGIGSCQIRSMILPLLADHVLREANHYIRLLEE